MAAFYIEPERIELQAKRLDDIALQITDVQRRVAGAVSGLSGIGLAAVAPNILAIEASLLKHKLKVKSMSDALSRISRRFQFAEESIRADVFASVIERIIAGVEVALTNLFTDIQGIIGQFHDLIPTHGTIGSWAHDLMTPIIEFIDGWTPDPLIVIENPVIPGVDPGSLIGEWIEIGPVVPIVPPFPPLPPIIGPGLILPEIIDILPIDPIHPIQPIHPIGPDFIHPIGPEIIQPIHPIGPDFIHPIGPEIIQPIHPIGPDFIHPIGPEIIQPIHPIGPEIIHPIVIDPIIEICPVEPIIPHIEPIGPINIDPIIGPHIEPIGPHFEPIYIDPIIGPHIEPIIGPEFIFEPIIEPSVEPLHIEHQYFYDKTEVLQFASTI